MPEQGIRLPFLSEHQVVGPDLGPLRVVDDLAPQGFGHALEPETGREGRIATLRDVRQKGHESRELGQITLRHQEVAASTHQ